MFLERETLLYNSLFRLLSVVYTCSILGSTVFFPHSLFSFPLFLLLLQPQGKIPLIIFFGCLVTFVYPAWNLLDWVLETTDKVDFVRLMKMYETAKVDSLLTKCVNLL